MEGPQFETNIHKKYRPNGIVSAGIDIYNGNAAIVESRYIQATGVTFPVLTYGNALSQLYGMSTSHFVIVGIGGHIKYIGRSYQEDELEAHLDALVSTIEEKPRVIPEDFYLNQNFPNPFNAKTTISYELISDGDTPVNLSVYDILGRRITVLVDEPQRSGFYSEIWDGRTETGEDAPSAYYFYTLKIGNRSVTRKMLLLR